MDSKQSSVEKERLEEASSEEIKRDIRGTRRSMDETLNELGDRLHPRHLLDDVMNLFRGSDDGASPAARSSRKAGRRIMQEIKERPLPALLVGAGIAWWIIDAVSDDEEEGRFAETGAYPPASSRRRELPEIEHDERSSYSGVGATPSGEGTDPGMASRAKEKAADAASAAGEKVSDGISAVGDKLSQAGSAVESGLEGIRSGGRAVSRYSARGARAGRRAAGEAQERFREASEEHPLAVGGAFLAAGVLAGLLLPRSEREDEWMGEASDQLKEETRAKGEELVERGKNVAGQAAATALDEAEARGVTPENLADKAIRVVTEAVKAGKETAREEGIAPSQLAKDVKRVAETTKETAKSSSASEAEEAGLPKL